MVPEIRRDRIQHRKQLLPHVQKLSGILVEMIKGILSPPLAMLYRRMFERWRRLDHLNTSIRYSWIALSTTPNHHPKLPHYQTRLSSSLRRRYGETSVGWDLYLAFLLQKSALAAVSPHNPSVAWYVDNLVWLSRRIYSRLRKVEYLRTSLEYQHRVLSVLPEGHVDRAWLMNSIAKSYSTLYDAAGNAEDIESGAHWATVALESTSPNDKDYAERQSDLADILESRAGISLDVEIVNRVINLRMAVLEVTTSGTIDHATRTMLLAQSYRLRYGRTRNPEDLDAALRFSMQALDNLPRTYPLYSRVCHIVSRLFVSKYRRDRDITDLRKALRYAQDAENLAKHESPSQIAALKEDMADIYDLFYHRLGSTSDLELAISSCEAGLALRPEGHGDLPHQRLHLSSLYCFRYLRHRDAQDLGSALELAQLAREKMPKTDPKFLEPLVHLADLFRLKVGISHDVKDMDQATAFMQEVLDQTPQDDRNLPERYRIMASLCFTRYDCFGGFEARNDILKWMRMAVEAGERLNDPDLPDLQNSLARQLVQRYIRLREENDLQVALQLALASTSNTPDDHTATGSRYGTLALIYEHQFALDRTEELKKLSMDAYRRAAASTNRDPGSQWNLARRWTSFADSVQSPESLDAYTYAFGVLPALLWVGTNITTRHEVLVKYNVTQLAANAVASCVLHKNYEAAVEFFEQSLSITFNQLLDLQADFSLLEPHHPELADNLRRVSAELGQLVTVTGERDGDPLQRRIPLQMADRMRRLAMERDALLEETRALPGLEHFLLPTPFSKLREAAAHGPIVMISCTRDSSEALIMLNPNRPVIHERLRFVDAGVLKFQQQRHQKALENLGIHTRDLGVNRAGRVSRRTPDQHMLNEVLEWLWTYVVSPIYGVLRQNGITGGRLWWCPTGPLTYLPLHAAGPLNDFIPSYTSTLSGLIRGRSREPMSALHSKVTIVGISESPSGAFPPLPSVMREVKVIRESVGVSRTSVLVNGEATMNNVLAALPDAQWLHLACHGQQGGAKEPLKSCLLLSDGQLYLKQLLTTPLKKAEFIFLSACETARGDAEMSNESLHLAGGLMFTGFKGAIATMWSINDDDGPTVARIVYEHLFAGGGERTVVDSAEALKKAVDYLRSGGVPAHRWVPFIHLGI